MNQSQLIYNFNDNYRPKFNRELFVRNDDDIIECLKDIILSIQRDSIFTIKVLDFEVIDNYDDVNHVMWEYENSIINKNKNTDTESKSSKSNSVINQFEYINLKSSAIKILKVNYFIQITEKKNGLVSDTVTVYIAVPRIVDDFYFKINGNIYSAMYQIVDASTYNNSTAKSAKKQSIIFKTVFMPIRMYRYTSSLKNLDGDSIPCTYFLANMFTKTILVMKYIFAKMGFYKTLEFFKVPGLYVVRNLDNINRDENHIFPVRDTHFIVVSKFIYDNNPIAQSLVYTIHSVCNYMKNSVFSEVFETNFWLKALGAEFTNKDIDTICTKGISILASLEFIYDLSTKNDLKLDLEDKDDIYRVLRWMMYEFNALMKKDNLDISTKKVRYAEYIAALYAAKLANGIYRLSDKADKADLSVMRKALQIPPMYLLNAITKSQLINYKDCVNDLDSLTALKYTYKGVSGIGENSNAISSAYRSIHPSHLGRVDIDSSSNSDPGVSGSLCPLNTLHNLHFIDFKEPSTWQTEISGMINQYKTMNNKIEICRLISDNNLSDKQNNNTILNECVSINRELMNTASIVLQDEQIINGYDIFGNGIMFCMNE